MESPKLLYIKVQLRFDTLEFRSRTAQNEAATTALYKDKKPRSARYRKWTRQTSPILRVLGHTSQYGWDFPEEIPERPLRKRSQSFSWNSSREHESQRDIALF